MNIYRKEAGMREKERGEREGKRKGQYITTIFFTFTLKFSFLFIFIFMF